MQNQSRRSFLRGATATGVLVGAASTGLLSTQTVFAAWPEKAFKSKAMEEALKNTVGSATPKNEKVTLKAPTIAENGAVVPITVTVDSPMSADDYVKDIYIYAEANPQPVTAIFHLTPESGSAEVQVRIKMGKTGNVRAVAVTNKGAAYQASSEVKVTIGGCGG